MSGPDTAPAYWRDTLHGSWPDRSRDSRSQWDADRRVERPNGGRSAQGTIERGVLSLVHSHAMLEHNQISRVILKNYKSIRRCDVSLGALTFLVGPNGAGKSNFVEALRFLSYALSTSLEQALENRAGFQSIAHRGPERASSINFGIFFNLGRNVKAQYSVEIRAVQDGPAVVTAEDCSVDLQEGRQWFRVDEGAVTSNQGVMPVASEDKLYLVNASGLPAFEPVYRALSNVVVYNPLPDEIRGFKPEKRYRNLDRSGSALAETISKMKDAAPDRLARVRDYLQRINSNIVDVDVISVDSNFNLRFELDRGEGRIDEFPGEQHLRWDFERACCTRSPVSEQQSLSLEPHRTRRTRSWVASGGG